MWQPRTKCHTAICMYTAQDRFIALDERGRAVTSEDMARLIAEVCRSCETSTLLVSMSTACHSSDLLLDFGCLPNVGRRHWRKPPGLLHWWPLWLLTGVNLASCAIVRGATYSFSRYVGLHWRPTEPSTFSLAGGH
jgi:hypothetical protein